MARAKVARDIKQQEPEALPALNETQQAEFNGKARKPAPVPKITYGVGGHIKKIVPSKRVRVAHRRARTGMSLKAWAQKQALSDEVVRQWFKNKRAA